VIKVGVLLTFVKLGLQRIKVGAMGGIMIVKELHRAIKAGAVVINARPLPQKIKAGVTKKII